MARISSVFVTLFATCSVLASIANATIEVDTHPEVAYQTIDGFGESDAWRAQFVGKTGLTSESSPPVGQAIIQSDVGYHIRAGGHSIEAYDWQRFLDFADYHFKN